MASTSKDVEHKTEELENQKSDDTKVDDDVDMKDVPTISYNTVNNAFKPRRRRRRSPPPSSLLRETIAKSIIQIMVNMTQPELKLRCHELLQVDDLIDGYDILLSKLEAVDAVTERRLEQQRKRRERKKEHTL